MYTAVYYPYIQIEEPPLLKQALFLWDKLEVIAPKGFRRHPRFQDRDLNEASDLLVSFYHPTDEDQRTAHKIIVEITKDRLPSWFYFKASSLRDFIYSRKFLDETWEYLRNKELASPDSKGARFFASPAFALVMMSVLADSCAGRAKRTVTGEWVAYGALSRYITLLNKGSYGLDHSNDADVVAAIPFRSIDLNAIPLANLLRLRKKESGNDGHLYRRLRHNLVKDIDDHVKDLAIKNYSAAERDEVQRVFDNHIATDYAELREELGDAAKECLLSKEMLAVVVGAAGSAVNPIAGGVVAVGGLLGVARKYQTARRKSLRGHITSYVYLAQQGRFEWR